MRRYPYRATAILACALLSTCVSSGSKAQSLSTVYISRIQGVDIYPTMSDEYYPKVHLPYNTRAEWVESEKPDFQNLGTHVLRYQGRLYATYRDAFSLEANPQRFRIVSKSGLNLRDAPNLKARVKTVIPFLAPGTVTAVKQSVEKIQGRTGYWLQVSYRDKTGWLFSGFVLTGDSDEATTLRTEKFDIRQAEFAEISTGEQVKGPNPVAEIDGIQFVYYPKPADDCSTSAKIKLNSIYVQDYKGRRLSIPGATEELVQTNIKHKRLIVTFHTYCICCCPNGSHVIYLKRNREITPYLLSLGKYQGSCGPEGPEPDIETRISPDRTKVMTLVKTPICEGTFATDGPIDFSRITNIDYIRGNFALFDIVEGNVQKIETLTIPKQYTELWEKSFILVGI